MKKGVIVVLILLAVVVLVSPAIVGRLAEKSMDENLNWAAEEAGGVQVTSEAFDRGWFSSEGQHRVELQDGQVLSALKAMGFGGEPDELPVLIINTRLDHGLIPVTSMAREKGALTPGLGSAVSTMQVELPGGESIDIPGKIYSNIGILGEMNSTYMLEAGERSEDDVTASWGETVINVTTDPSSGEVEFDGSVGPLSVGDDSEVVKVAALRFEGDQAPTQYGFMTGDVDFELSGMSVSQSGTVVTSIETMSVEATSELDGDRLDGHATMAMAMRSIPNVGDVTVDMDFRLTGANAAAIGKIQAALEDVDPGAQDPNAIYGTIEADLKSLFAAGFGLEFERLDVALPQGTVTTRMKFNFGEEDAATFDWPSLLLSTEASIDVSIPAELVDAMTQTNPQAAMAIAAGYLVKNGDAYEMKAELRKGLATINGAPIPIPAGGM